MGWYEKFELHVAAICFREHESKLEVLCAKRTPERTLYPGKWECGGGAVKKVLKIVVKTMIVFSILR